MVSFFVPFGDINSCLLCVGEVRPVTASTDKDRVSRKEYIICIKL